jgi:hypothetical protein
LETILIVIFAVFFFYLFKNTTEATTLLKRKGKYREGKEDRIKSDRRITEYSKISRD